MYWLGRDLTALALFCLTLASYTITIAPACFVHHVQAHRKRQKGSDGKSRSPDSHQGGQSEQMGSEIYSDTYSQSHDSPYTNAADDDDDGQDEDDNDDDDDDNDDNDDDGDNDDDDQDDDQDDGDDDDDDQQDSLHSSDAGQARAHGGQGQWAGHGSVEISNLTGAY